MFLYISVEKLPDKSEWKNKFNKNGGPGHNIGIMYSNSNRLIYEKIVLFGQAFSIGNKRINKRFYSTFHERTKTSSVC